MLYFLILIIVILLIYGKTYFNGSKNKFSNSDLTNKIIIITGSNQGIGKETAMELSNTNATLIFACRNEQKTLLTIKQIKKISKNNKLFFIQLDLSNFNSIVNFVKEFKSKFKRLDILINNAGIIGSQEKQLTQDQNEITFQTNHLGPFLLTNLLLDMIKNNDQNSRIINVASLVHSYAKLDLENLNCKNFYGINNLSVNNNLYLSINQKYLIKYLQVVKVFTPKFFFEFFLVYINNYRAMWPIPLSKKNPAKFSSAQFNYISVDPKTQYPITKLCNILFTNVLSKKFENSNVKVCSLSPGIVRTDIAQHFFDSWILRIIFTLGYPLYWYFTKNSWYGAQTTLHCALMPFNILKNGAYYSECSLQKEIKVNDEDCQKLNQISEKLTKKYL